MAFSHWGLLLSYSKHVEILLATYNGEAFLDEQLNSLVAQDHENWSLLVRDDGSEDGTIGILEKFQSRYPEKVKLISGPKERLGVSANFMFLLGESKSEFFAFCDQDDIWRGDRLSRGLQLMEPGNLPQLVHSDLSGIDEEGQKVYDSFFEYSGKDPSRVSFPEILYENVVSGCTCLGNQALRKRAMLFKDSPVMHDWWLSLVASAFGKVHLYSETLVNYRSHFGNSIKTRERKYIRLKVINIFAWWTAWKRTVRMAKNFIESFPDAEGDLIEYCRKKGLMRSDFYGFTKWCVGRSRLFF